MESIKQAEKMLDEMIDLNDVPKTVTIPEMAKELELDLGTYPGIFIESEWSIKKLEEFFYEVKDMNHDELMSYSMVEKIYTPYTPSLVLQKTMMINTLIHHIFEGKLQYHSMEKRIDSILNVKKEYKNVPIQSCADVMDRFDKDQAVLVCWDDEYDKVSVTSFTRGDRFDELSSRVDLVKESLGLSGELFNLEIHRPKHINSNAIIFGSGSSEQIEIT